LAACSLTTPFERTPASLAASDEITTGSISQKARGAVVSPLSPRLDQEDWRRASAALATALDPQGNGALVRWDNAASGAKGSFSPVGDPFLVRDEICRSFIAALTVDGAETWLQGGACRQSPTQWTIKDVKPWRRPD
jgi:surface antigen